MILKDIANEAKWDEFSEKMTVACAKLLSVDGGNWGMVHFGSSSGGGGFGGG